MYLQHHKSKVKHNFHCEQDYNKLFFLKCPYLFRNAIVFVCFDYDKNVIGNFLLRLTAMALRNVVRFSYLTLLYNSILGAMPSFCFIIIMFLNNKKGDV